MQLLGTAVAKIMYAYIYETKLYVFLNTKQNQFIIIYGILITHSH